MRVQIVYTVEVSDGYRLAINRHHERLGRAGVAEIRAWLMEHGTSMDGYLLDMDTAKAAQR